MRLPPGVRRAAARAQDVDRVEEHVERALGRRQRVEVVPRHRPRLVGQHRHHDRRAVRDRVQRPPRLAGQIADRGARRRRPSWRRSRAARAARGRRRRSGSGRARARSSTRPPAPRRRARPFGRARRRCRRSSVPAPPTMLRERPAAGAPDEREVARARALGDLLRLGGGARDGRPEHQVRIAGQRSPSHSANVCVVAVREQAAARLGRRLARAAAWPRARSARRRGAGARPRASSARRSSRRKRQAHRVQLGAAADEQLAVQLERDEVAGHGHATPRPRPPRAGPSRSPAR